jgi:hypothetical protein
VFGFIRVFREYERGVVFRLGRLMDPLRGPGLVFLIPIVDRPVKVDLRTVTLNIPPQEVITKDNVPAKVNAVAYFRIVEPKAAIVQIENFIVATSQIAQTTLGVTPLIARRATVHGSGLGSWRWVVERTFAWLHQYRRLHVRYDRSAETHQALLDLACCLICYRRLQHSLC